MSTPAATRRALNEIGHGSLLAQGDPELTWGWGTPAGRLRAARRAQLIVSGAELRTGVRALEVGCGTGLFTEFFAQSGARIVAVDISPDLLARARTRDLPSTVEFVEARFEDIETERPFDAVIGSSILHHLEIEDSLRRMHALLRPGGRISFAEPNMLNPQIFAERRFRSLFPQVSPDETAFVRWRLARMLYDVGFRDVLIRPFDWLHPYTPARLIPVVRLLGRALERLPAICELAGSLHIQAVR